MSDTPFVLRAHAKSTSSHAHVPYSGAAVGAALLLADGTWVPGVRVENASFPLTVPALLAAYYTTRCAGRGDVVAAVQTTPFPDDAVAVLSAALDRPFQREGDALVLDGADLPIPAERLDPLIAVPGCADDVAGLALAHRVAERAYAPFSNFPVGCVAEAADGRLIPGCNIEHADWTRGLCAERVALVTAQSYGITDIRRLWLACPKAPGATPCGACRQVIAELAPGAIIVFPGENGAPVTTTPDALLPGAFGGERLRG